MACLKNLIGRSRYSIAEKERLATFQSWLNLNTILNIIQASPQPYGTSVRDYLKYKHENMNILILLEHASFVRIITQNGNPCTKSQVAADPLLL